LTSYINSLRWKNIVWSPKLREAVITARERSRAVDCPNRFQGGEVPVRVSNRNGIIPRLVAATGHRVVIASDPNRLTRGQGGNQPDCCVKCGC
jgi:hypothetical protein